jgi:hypothetical protein
MKSHVNRIDSGMMKFTFWIFRRKDNTIMKPKLSFICIALLILSLTTASLQAQVPQLLNYQGKLAINGAPANGPVTLTFSIYPSANGGTSLWSETRNNVPFTNGLFNIQLGEVNGLPDSLFTRYSELFLGIKIGTSSAPELIPRSQLTSVAFARKANSANALDAPDGTPSKAVVVDNNGNVGIGTTTPNFGAYTGNTLSIQGLSNSIPVIEGKRTIGTTSSTVFSLRGNNSNGILAGVDFLSDTQDGRSGALVFQTADVGTLGEKMRITSTGNVGIGATSPEAQLHIGTAGLGDAGVGFRMGSFGKFIIDSDNVVGGRFTVLKNGNVGIGTNGPAFKLHVVDNSKSTAMQITQSNVEGYGLLITPGSDNNYALLINNAADNINRHVFNGNGNAYLALNGGNVGIGTTSPAYKLHVSDDMGVESNKHIFARYLADESYKASLGWNHLQLGNNGTNYIIGGRTQAGGSIIFVTNNTNDYRSGATSHNGIEAMTISDNGNVGIGMKPGNVTLSVSGAVCSTTNQFISCSDIRYKKSIASISNALDKVARLRGVSFDWRKEEFPELNFSAGRNLGFIAQEIKEVLPEVVSQDAKGYYSVAYSQVVPVLVEAIKEQQKELAATQTELQNTKAELASFKEKMSRLESSLHRLEQMAAYSENFKNARAEK